MPETETQQMGVFLRAFEAALKQLIFILKFSADTEPLAVWHGEKS